MATVCRFRLSSPPFWTALAWLSVVVYHAAALWVGGAWMLFGLTAYVIYRKGAGTTLTRRIEVPAEALVKGTGELEYGDILVPVFGTELDDDIVSTAGRLADAADMPGEERLQIEVIYVIEMPLTVPLASPPPDRHARCRSTPRSPARPTSAASTTRST